MVTTNPITSAGPREPVKRPQAIPRHVKTVIELMVFGRPDDENCKPLDFIEAAKQCGVNPCVMRRWLDRPTVRAYLMAQRRAFRTAVCAGNELALQRVRDKSKNGMVTVAAVRALEGMDAEEQMRRPNQPSPGVTIRIVNVVQQPAQSASTIDVTPQRPGIL